MDQERVQAQACQLLLIRQVLGAFAQFEKSTLVAKLRCAREAKRQRDGRCEGRKPFGHWPGERADVDRIRQLRRRRDGRRMAYARIAETLNAEGVLTRYGRPWNQATVWSIVLHRFPAMA